MGCIDLTLGTIPSGSLLRIEDGGRGVVVVRTGDTIAAFEDVCPHAGFRLSDGELANGILECPGHGWEFDAATGHCVTVPAYCLRPVSVVRQGQSISVAVGRDPNKSSPVVIADGAAIV